MAASEDGRGASPPSGAAPPALEVIGIEKWFGSVHANVNVSISIASGTIHGIIGENGAGKSTLMSVVYGYYQADSGEIRVNGEAVHIKGPEHAIAHGIGMVHQHFMLVSTFTVLENIVLGVESGRMLAPSLAAALFSGRKELGRFPWRRRIMGEKHRPPPALPRPLSK